MDPGLITLHFLHRILPLSLQPCVGWWICDSDSPPLSLRAWCALGLWICDLDSLALSSLPPKPTLWTLDFGAPDYRPTARALGRILDSGFSRNQISIDLIRAECRCSASSSEMQPCRSRSGFWILDLQVLGGVFGVTCKVPPPPPPPGRSLGSWILDFDPSNFTKEGNFFQIQDPRSRERVFTLSSRYGKRAGSRILDLGSRGYI